MIYQVSPFIEHHEKAEDGRWLFNAFDGLEDTFRLTSVELEIPLTDIHDRVEFSPKASEADRETTELVSSQY